MSKNEPRPAIFHIQAKAITAELAWVAVGPAMNAPRIWEPHVVALSGGSTGVKGRTPFEAIYRYKKIEAKQR